MCGRYAVTSQLKKLARKLGVSIDQLDEHLERERYNVAPSQQVPIIRSYSLGTELLSVRWGLIPFFAKGEPPKYSTINATIEKLTDGACWRGPWKRGQRCIMPASGFYEWQVRDDGTKQPFYIHCADQEEGFGFAALWDRSEKADGIAVESCTIITMPATPLMASIHNVKHRMPAILAEQDIDVWLNGTQEEARLALKQYSDDLLVAWPVSTRVNKPANNGPELISAI